MGKFRHYTCIFAYQVICLCIPLQEQPDAGENVDDDEDKKNPAYVPKRGAFYEHDMRISMDEQEEDDKK